ncbi:MAG: DUF1538 domain-containing protein [Clostridia bacterium]|nr:DUF1538 domain-containing protein [Clostridia bacterium]
MHSELIEKLKESTKSVVPISLLVLILSISVAPVGLMNIALFCISSILIIIGLTLFSLGAEISMLNIGERVGTHLVKTRKLYFMVFICFMLGVITTIAEPDLKVLASQVPMISDYALIFSVAIGVGIFLAIALLRILFQVKLSKLLIIFYAIVFIIAIFVPNEFLAVAFDSGGVTTGPITVPFIMSLGLGLSAVRKDKTSEEDTFGFVALASVGPILIVMILGLFSDESQITYTPVEMINYMSVPQIINEFVIAMPTYIHEVAIAMLPLIIFFIIYNFLALHIDKISLSKITFGIIYTFIGLVLFLTSVNVGFMPVGYMIGNELANDTELLLIPVGALVGYFIVSAEPAVMVLKKQVEEVTEGKVTGKILGTSLGLGIAFAVGLAMIRVLTGLSIMYFVIPGYLFAIAMMKFVPSIFTAISFDSGGVASGPMTATFLLPFAMGACDMLGGNIVTDAFGVVTMVAMTPLITIQALGLIYKRKEDKQQLYKKRFEKMLLEEDCIIDFEI